MVHGCWRAQLHGETLRYKEQISDGDKGTPPITDPETIRGFVVVFLRTLLGNEASQRQINHQLNDLRMHSSSTLFHGFGWKLTIGDEVYEKN